MLKRALPFFPILVILVFTACTAAPANTNTVSPDALTSAVQTIEATLQSPTPSTTPETDTRSIIDLLNGVIIGSDPLSETVEAKFDVLDIRLPVDPTSKQVVTMEIDVECEWIFSDSCTPEKGFVNLMHGFAADKKIMEKIRAQVPPTVKTLEVVTFDHRIMNGRIRVQWQDVVDFVAGKINGNQLGSRIVRLSH